MKGYEPVFEAQETGVYEVHHRDRFFWLKERHFFMNAGDTYSVPTWETVLASVEIVR